MVRYFVTGTIPALELHSLNVKNGKIKTFKTTRTLARLVEMRDEVNTTHQDLQKRGWWERKYAKAR